MSISDEQIAHDLAIAFVTSKMTKESNSMPNSSDYTSYKNAFRTYKDEITSVKRSIQNFERMNELD